MHVSTFAYVSYDINKYKNIRFSELLKIQTCVRSCYASCTLSISNALSKGEVLEEFLRPSIILICLPKHDSNCSCCNLTN